jgi:hypothetical protein
MGTNEHRDDVQVIEAIIDRQFASLNWAPGNRRIGRGFAADFLPEASLPAARPAKRQAVEAFIQRMKSAGLFVARLGVCSESG